MLKIILAMLTLFTIACGSAAPTHEDTTQHGAAPDFCYTRTYSDFSHGKVACDAATPLCAFDHAREPAPVESQLVQIEHYCTCGTVNYECYGLSSLAGAP